jgi:hypothetical protein
MLTYNEINVQDNTVNAEELLEKCRIDTSIMLPKPPTILYIKERSGTSTQLKRMFTLGNFSCLKGKAKAKKTFLLKLFTAAIMKQHDDYSVLCPDVTSRTSVLYFDTEQGEYDSQLAIKQIEMLAGETTSILRAYSLRQHDPNVRMAIIEAAINRYGSDTSFCVIDGIADIANAINDEIEATKVTSNLLRWTKDFNMHIATVLHENKNDNFATGWIGSQVMKKAEIVISVKKSEQDRRISDVQNDMGRGADFEPFSIYINDDGMPEIIDYVKPNKSRKQDTFTQPEEMPF